MFFVHTLRSLKEFQYWMLVSLLNIIGQYRQTSIGPMWIAASIGVFVFVLGNLYGSIWVIDKAYFMPYLTVGYVIWHMLSGTITQSLKIYVSNRNFIRQSKLPIPVYNLKSTFEILIIFAHNLLVVAAVILIYGAHPSFSGVLWFFIGVVFIVINMYWVSVLLGTLGAAYRDLHEFISVLMRVAFLATPVMWMVGKTGNRESISKMMLYNPFYHFIEIARAPLLDEAPAANSWLIVIAITLIGYGVTSLVYAKTYKRISIWV